MLALATPSHDLFDASCTTSASWEAVLPAMRKGFERESM
jgi:hypothetical protein